MAARTLMVARFAANLASLPPVAHIARLELFELTAADVTLQVWIVPV